MCRTKSFPVLLATLALSACAAVPPQGPTVIALPPEGKDLAQFQQEDTACRGYAQLQLGNAAPQQATTAELQQRYDIAYAQCMAADGNRPQALAMAWPFGPYGYPYPYPGFYTPWFAPSVTLGFFDGFGPRFHHHHFVHQGFRRG